MEYSDQQLHPVSIKLYQLEQLVVTEFYRLLDRAKHSRTEASFLRDELTNGSQTRAKFQAQLQHIVSEIGDTQDVRKLRIVSAFQEELRLRLLVIKNLLNCDIPYAYLDKALEGPIDPEAARKKLAQTIKQRAHTRENAFIEGIETEYTVELEEPHWFVKLLHALLPFLKPKQAPSPEPVRSRPAMVPNKASTAAIQIARGAVDANSDDKDENFKRLFLLHAVMANDELDIFPAEKRLPQLDFSHYLPKDRARFHVQDRAETHWGERVEGKARTPEELRKKFANRNYQAGNKGSATFEVKQVEEAI